jgi:tripartite-type tricarboxylate transporter receptor subunit TctC
MKRGAFLLVLVLGFALVAGVPATPAAAQPAEYPSRLVTIVAPSAPGGLYSLFARIIGNRLEQRLGRTFLVENRPGAASVLGAAAVARAPADGYTLMVASGATLAVNVTLHKTLPYDPVADFVPIALIARVPEVLVVDPALPVRSLADLSALAKSEPSRPLTFASAGPGTAQHLEGEMLNRALGLDMTHVPYKGALPALNDVIAGHVTMMFSPVANALPMIEAGKVRALGLAARERVEALPQVSPLAEIGVPGFEASGWFMLVAPAATPVPIVARLHAELQQILADPDLRRQFIRQGLIPAEAATPDRLKAYVGEQIAHWRETLARIGLVGME